MTSATVLPVLARRILRPPIQNHALLQTPLAVVIKWVLLLHQALRCCLGCRQRQVRFLAVFFPMMLILLAAGMCLPSVRAFSSSVAPRTFRPASSRLYSSSDTQETKAYFLGDDEGEITEGNVRVEINSKEPMAGNEHDPAKKDASVSEHANTVKHPSSKEETSGKQQLSDLDARVLKAMLQEDKLDLQQEENMKKLLERGVAPKSAPSFETQQKVEEEEDDSPFSSQLFKVRNV